MTMKLQPNYYNYMLNGTKTIEMRLNDEKRKTLKVGDTITFSKEPENIEKFKATIISLSYGNSFKELIDKNDIEVLADKSITKDDYLNDLNKYYSNEKQKELGVVAIEIKKDII